MTVVMLLLYMLKTDNGPGESRRFALALHTNSQRVSATVPPVRFQLHVRQPDTSLLHVWTA